MFCICTIWGVASPLGGGASCPEPRPLRPSCRPCVASFPGWRVWVQLSEHHGIHVPIRAKVQRRRPVLGRAAGVAHPVARAAVRVSVGHCREWTDIRPGSQAGARESAGDSVLSSSLSCPSLTMNSCLHPLSEPQNMNASALLGVCWQWSQRGSRAGPGLVGLPGCRAACPGDSQVVSSTS